MSGSHKGGRQLIDNITSVESLNPRQLAYIRRVWQRRKAGTIDRTYKQAMLFTGTAAGVALCLSSVGGASGWSPLVIWLLGFLFGTFYTGAIASLKGWRLWPAADVMLDWNRVEEIATADEQPSSTA